MYRYFRILSVLFLFSFVFVISASAGESEDRTLSPYFFVKSDSPDLDRLPLKSTSAQVDIAGVIADVKVTQVYANEGRHPLEAIYVFPASTRAAVYGMKMTIGERVITARIRKKVEARQEYEEAKLQGKSASLLEQQRPNVFQMNVANILPGDIVKVELSYTELLIPTDRVYEFVYPTVVGPRYSNQRDTEVVSKQWFANPYLHQGEAPNYSFDIIVNLSAGLPIQNIFCPSHKVHVSYNGRTKAGITLDKSEQFGGNRDYILQYRLAGDRVESGLLLYEGEKENFFLLMVQPPERVTESRIPGREYIFIVDVSGSMHGFPLEISKKLLRDLIGNLRPTDKFNVLLFSGGSSLMSEESVSATPGNIQRAIRVIDNQQGGGGTELLPALKKALTLPRAEGFSRSVVVVTDGYVNVEEQAFNLIRNNLSDANMFAFGIGTSVNRHLIEGIAHVGMGEPFVITNPDQAAPKAEAFRKLIQSPVLTRIKVNFEGFETYDLEPAAVPDVLAARPVILFGKWEGTQAGRIMLSGIAGDGPYSKIVDVSGVKPSRINSALQYLWARRRIMLLSDYNMLRPDDRRISEVTELGLRYNLLTAYTSFIAVDSESRNKSGQSSTVSQPLPLPEGVSDLAVGSGYVLQRSGPAPFRAITEQKKIESADAAEPMEVDRGTVIGMQVRLEKIVVSGGLSRKSVESTIQEIVTALTECTPSATGRVSLKLTIKADGSVGSVHIVSSEFGNASFRKCLLETIRRWRFAIPAGAKQTAVRISLVFN